MLTIENQLALELKVRPEQIQSAVALLDGGATVPFIARYRKEATGNLDDIQLRELEARLAYLRELQARRETVIQSIREQGKLTPELLAAIEAAPTKQELEDIYLPYVWEHNGGKREIMGTEPFFQDQHIKTPSLNRSTDINHRLALDKINNGIIKPKSFIRFNWKKLRK